MLSGPPYTGSITRCCTHTGYDSQVGSNGCHGDVILWLLLLLPGLEHIWREAAVQWRRCFGGVVRGGALLGM